MVYLYRDNEDDDLLVSQSREYEWEEELPEGVFSYSFLGEFSSRDELSEFLECLRGVIPDRRIDAAMMIADYMNAWEV